MRTAAAFCDLAFDPAELGGDRVHAGKHRKQNCEYQRARQAGPQKRDRENFYIAATHPEDAMAWDPWTLAAAVFAFGVIAWVCLGCGGRATPKEPRADRGIPDLGCRP